MDADPVGGTLLFTQDGATVVAEAGDRRDARSAGDEPAEAAARAGRSSLLDLPTTSAPEPKKDDDGERLN